VPTWTAVTVIAEPELVESIGSFLTDHGAPGLVTEECDDLVRVTGHFVSAAPVADFVRFCDQLQEWFPGSSRPRFDVAPVPDTDWAENWKQHFPPLAIGDRLFIHPPWLAEVPAERVGVEIDPGMAFGTGHHASTHASLFLLDRIARSRRMERVLDLGTGSGILAIAAAKLGATEVWAVDIDADACRVTRVNLAVNAVTERIHVRESLDDVGGTFDLVLANLFTEQLVELAPRLAALLQPNGNAIGAGILANACDDVVRAWEAAGLQVIDRLCEDEWAAILACRR
jgi:ribosomal protein L11 methyltransferase